MLRTLIDEDSKKVVVVTVESEDEKIVINKIGKKLKVLNLDNISVIRVNYNGTVVGTDKKWTEVL